MEINVLSLFDGISCGQQALERAGFKVDKYFASEIDKYAIQVTMANYPNTIQLGSVVNVDGYSLPKIDLLIGGSPCQSFSFAGKRKGMATKCETEILTLEHYLELKEQGFEFEGQSYLFWEYMRLLNECKPTYFLLENVEMGEKWEKVLSKAIGVNGIHINSSLVSAQNRKRIYWTNIGMQPKGFFGDMESIIKQPKDKGILLKHILESEVDEKYFLSEKMTKKMSITNESKNIIGHSGTGGQKGIIHNVMGQSSSLCATDYKQAKQILVHNTNAVEVKLKKPNVQIQKTIDKNTFIEGEIKALDFYNQSKHDKCPTLADPSHGHLGLIAPTESINPIDVKDLKINNSQSGAVYDINNKSVPLCANGGGQGAKTGLYLIPANSVEIKRQIITHNIPEIVSVRKYEVDVLGLQKTLKEHKKTNNQQIANELGVPKTMVEHWFRTDTYFSIPDKDIWLKLKELLKISTNEFDESIMTFEEKESIFEKTNRVYDENGISPTLTSTSADERILVRNTNNSQEEEEINVYDGYNNRMRTDEKCGSITQHCSREGMTNGFKIVVRSNGVEMRQVIQLNPSTESGGKQPYQQNRIYDINGISPALMQGKSDLIIKEEYFEVNNKQNKEELILAGNLKGGRWDNTHETSGRVYDANGKAPTIPTMQGGNQHPKALFNSRIRRLTPTECERLQTVKDGYTAHVSDSQRYKQLGNGWTVDVISHIFSYCKF